LGSATSRLTRIKPAQDDSQGMVLAIDRDLWPGAAACGWKTILDHGCGNQNSVRIRMIFGWRVRPAKRDNPDDSARNVNPHQASIQAVEKILPPSAKEEIIAMAST